MGDGWYCYTYIILFFSIEIGISILQMRNLRLINFIYFIQTHRAGKQRYQNIISGFYGFKAQVGITLKMIADKYLPGALFFKRNNISL